MIRVRARHGVHALDPGTLAGAWRWCWPRLGDARRTLVGALLCTIAYTALTILRPWPLKFVLDYAIVPDADRGPVPLLGGASSREIIAVSAAAILVTAALAALAAYGQRFLGARAGQVLAHRLRRDLFCHVQRLSLAEHDRSRAGDLVLRLTADMSLLRNLLVPSTLKLLSQWLVVAGVSGLLIWLDLSLAVLAVGVVPPLILSASRSGRRIREEVREQRMREGEFAAVSSETIGSIALVKLHGTEESEADRLQGNQNRTLQTGLRATRLQAAFERKVELLVAVGTCLVLAFGAHRVLAGTLTPGDLVLAVAYVGMLAKPLRSFSRLTGRLAKGVVAAERVIRTLELPAEELRRPDAIVPERVEGHLRFDDVWFRYGRDEWVLRGASCEIRPGERVALVGRSGSGKTTLVRLIPRLYVPERGSVSLDGIPLDRLQLAFLRDRISFVLQETLLLGVSVRDNITYGADDLGDEEVEHAARAAHIHDRIRALPDGYATILGERGSGLSGGERQRVALARAFARRSPIVVLDEPDTWLDARGRSDLWSAIEEVTRGRTSVCIVHDVRNAARADRIIVMDEGCIVGTGMHAELIETCPAYRDLFEASHLEGTASRAAR